MTHWGLQLLTYLFQFQQETKKNRSWLTIRLYNSSDEVGWPTFSLSENQKKNCYADFNVTQSMQKQNWQEWMRLILCYIEVSSYWPICFNSRMKKEKKRGKKIIALGRKSDRRALPMELDDLQFPWHRKTIVSTILTSELYKSIHKLLVIPRFVRMRKTREKKMMRMTSKLGSWGMVILLLTRAPDGTSCWINTCLTKECRRQWRPTADPHVLLLLLLLLWQPPPPSMAGGCLSPTWTCDWSWHVLVRCSNQSIQIARERESARVCVKVTNEESYFRCKFAILPRTAETSHKRGKKKLRPLQKKKTAKLNCKPKKPDIFCHLPVSIWGQKTQLRFLFFLVYGHQGFVFSILWYWKFCTNFLKKRKKSSKISQLYTRKNHIFPENFPTFDGKFDKICPKNPLMCMPVYVCGFLLHIVKFNNRDQPKFPFVVMGLHEFWFCSD